MVTFPTVCAHIIGQFLKLFGDDRIVFGSDSVWYGAPQWQIEAVWRFQIPEEMRRQYDYPRLKRILEFPGFTAAEDNLSRFRKEYLAMGCEPSNARYGWIRTS